MLYIYPNPNPNFFYWEFVGGPFWIVQEELIRHAVLPKLNQQLALFYTSVGELEEKTIDENLNENLHFIIDIVIPDCLPKYVQNRTVRKKVAQLKLGFKDLLKEMRMAEFPMSCFRNYRVKSCHSVLVLS